MQSEFTSSALAWGFSTFSKSKCLVRALSSCHGETTYSLLNTTSSSSKTDDSAELTLHECSPTDTIVVSQGSRFEIGVEFSPAPSFTDSFEQFVESFEKHKEILKFDIRLQMGDQTVVPRETASIQKMREDIHDLDCTVFRKNPCGFYIGMNTSLQIPREFINAPIVLVVAVSVAIPESSCPSYHRSTMSEEELSLRALLEGGRYRVPKIDPIEISQPAVVINALEVECWSKAISPWRNLLGIELTNSHPYKDLVIENIEVNLPATLSIHNNPGRSDADTSKQEISSGSNLFTPCYPPVHEWLDTISVPTSKSSTKETDGSRYVIASGETQTVLFKVCQKDACHQNLTSSIEEQSATQTDHIISDKFAQTLYGIIPPPSLSGNFASPVDIRWFENPSAQPCSIGVDMSCIGTNFRQTTVPIYWHLDKRMGTEFVVDVSGPDTGECHKPFTLEITVTNCTQHARNLTVYLQDPSLISSLELRDEPLDSYLNHETAVSLANTQPGKGRTFSIQLYPLRRGQLEFTEIFIVDSSSNEVFTTSSAFTSLIS